MDEFDVNSANLLMGASSGGILDKSSEEQDAYAKRAFEEVDGLAKDDEKEKAMLLYIAQKKIKAMDFPDRCIYATH